MELILRVVFSLLVVLGLMWFLARFARRPLRGRDTEAFSVVERRQLTRTASVAIVRVAGRALVLGITETNVSLLGEADLADLQAPRADTVRREPVRLPAGQVPFGPVPGDQAAADPLAADPVLDGLSGDDRVLLEELLGERSSGAPALGEPVLGEPALGEGMPLRKLPRPLNGGSPAAGASARGGGGRLAGSALSPQTWATAVEVLRARTVRKS